jgi:hypothetical protein
MKNYELQTQNSIPLVTNEGQEEVLEYKKPRTKYGEKIDYKKLKNPLNDK